MHYLLGNNTIPREAELTVLRNSIRCSTERIEHLDRSIASLQDQLRKLQVYRDQEAYLKSTYLSILCPMRASMPPEIMEEIFLVAASQRLSSRITVSHVSRFWRRVALGCSELWTTIAGDAQAPNKQAQIEYTSAIIARAWHRPLSMFRTNPLLSRFSTGSMTVVDALSKHPWRELSWKNMDFICFDAAVRVLSTSKQHRQFLKTLELECVPDTYFRSSGHPHINPDAGIMRFQHLRSLKRLSLGLCYELDFTNLDAPWMILTHLSLNATTVKQSALVQVILQCTSIEDLTLSFRSVTFAGSSSNSPLTLLPNLRRMHLTSAHTSLFDWMAGACVTPNLEELIIDAGLSTFELMNLDGLSHFILVNSETLRRLWITGVGDIGSEEMDLISQLAVLEELSLVVNDFVDASALDKLQANYAWPPVHTQVARNSPFSRRPASLYINNTTTIVPCPSLRVLRIVCPLDRHSKVPRHFAGLLRTRWWPDSKNDYRPLRPITRLTYASLQDRVSPERISMVGELNLLVEKGLKLNVFPPTSEELIPHFWEYDRLS